MEKSTSKDHTQVAVASGPLKLLDIEIDCYVTKDGTPVMSSGKITKAIGKQWRGVSRSEYPIFLGAINLTPFITIELLYNTLTFVSTDLDRIRFIVLYSEDC